MDKKRKSRKIAYILGAGFSYGANHKITIGQSTVSMPLQNTLLEELCVFHHRHIDKLTNVMKYIRKYFSPGTYRSQHKKGSKKHADLYGLSIEEIYTFYDELLRAQYKSSETEKIIGTMAEIRSMTIELISYLSANGYPGQNNMFKDFVDRLAQTDVVITFNWDTLLDQVLTKRKSYWHPKWGYGKTVRNNFIYLVRGKQDRRPTRRYIKYLKLHGSINWSANDENRGIYKKPGVIAKAWCFKLDEQKEVVMMPPKMIKTEIWGEGGNRPQPVNGNYGNEALQKDKFYPSIWKEAQEQLERCRRIVFIGYSFPPADFAVANMIRRAVSKMKTVEQVSPEIDIVDPNVAELAKRFEKSFNIKVPQKNQYLTLENYLSTERQK